MIYSYFESGLNHQPKKFFQVESTRLADLFELLNSSSTIGRGTRVLVRQPKTAVF